MKKIITVTLVFLLFACVFAAGAQAITFSEVPLLTTDPTIEGISFWAGDPSVYNDTMVNDFWSPGNSYLMSGFDDGTGKSPDLYDTFIGITSGSGNLFSTVTLDILSEMNLPGGTTLWLTGLLGGSAVGSTSLTVSDNAYHSLTLAFASGADTIHIFDNLNSSNLGEAFHIDNFTYSLYQEGPKPVPEPSTMVLVSAGLIGTWLWQKRKNNS